MSGSSERGHGREAGPGAGPEAGRGAASVPGQAAAAEYAEDVVLGADLHMRPAGAVVRTAARYAADVELVACGRVARASSVLELMGLGARAGTPVTVRGRGTDAAAAVGGLAVQLREPA